MRLDRWLAAVAGLSRSQARSAIRSGQVQLQGQCVRQIAMQVDPGMQMRWQGSDHLFSESAQRYLMYHKPVGEVCSREDAHHPLVFDRWSVVEGQHLMTVGRLDCDTSGLLLLTTDGQWSQQLRKPGRHVKTYDVLLYNDLTEIMREQLLGGVELRGEAGRIQVCWLEQQGDRQVRMGVSEGRYHLVRRLWAAVGNHVVALHRSAIGAVVLDEQLEAGHWRDLREDEISLLDVSNSECSK